MSSNPMREEKTYSWVEYHGMDTVIERIKTDCGFYNNATDINTWTCSAVAKGPETVVQDFFTGLNNINLIEGLLLSGTIGFLVDPPGVIAELEKDDWHQLVYVWFMGMSVFFHIFGICLSVGFQGAVLSSARHSDKFRILSLHGSTYAVNFVVFVIGIAFLGVAGLATAVKHYDVKHSIGVITTGICLLIGALVMNLFYLRAADIGQSWRNQKGATDPNTEDPFDLSEPLAAYIEIAEYAASKKKSKSASVSTNTGSLNAM